MTAPCLDLAFSRQNIKWKVFRLAVQVNDSVPICQAYIWKFLSMPRAMPGSRGMGTDQWLTLNRNQLNLVKF